jgi:hypothetical protein
MQQLSAAVAQPPSRQPQPGYPPYPQQPQYGQPQQPQYAPPAPPTLPSQDDFLTRPAEATKQYMEYLKQTEFQPWQQQTTTAVASTNRALAELQDPATFKKYGPEIDLTLRQYAPNPEAWTVENIKKVAAIVRSNHIDEIAEERARALMQQNADRLGIAGASLRPDGTPLPAGASAAGPNQLDFTKLPPQFSKVLQRVGVDQATLDEFLMATKVRHEGLSLDQARAKWMQEAQRGDIFTDGLNQNEIHSVPLNEVKAPIASPEGGLSMRQLGYQEKF